MACFEEVKKKEQYEKEEEGGGGSEINGNNGKISKIIVSLFKLNKEHKITIIHQ